MDELNLRDYPEGSRFELHLRGQLKAHTEYNLLSNAVMFTHTEVQPEGEGQGYASTLIKFALDSVRERGLNVIPVCPFVAAYIRRHPEYRDLVAESHRRAFNA